MQQHVREWWWFTATTLKVDGKTRSNCDRESVRADHVMKWYAKCYWPMDLVEPFVRENWCAVLRKWSSAHT